jgi:hypothetical protein
MSSSPSPVFPAPGTEMSVPLVGRCSVFSTPQFSRNIQVRIGEPIEENKYLQCIVLAPLVLTGRDKCTCGNHDRNDPINVPEGAAVDLVMVQYQDQDHNYVTGLALYLC